MTARHEVVRWKDNHMTHKALLAGFKLTSDSEVCCCTSVMTNDSNDFSGAGLDPLTCYLLTDVH